MNVQRAIKLQPGGIPFSVKDHLKVEGMIESCGFSDNLVQSTTTSDVVKLLEMNGCIAYAHSNVPQGILGIESHNYVYGMSGNPWKEGFVSGGSSGGEAALVATRTSAFGICSDSGGSARIPASFCGVYGFKPTGSKRLSIRGRVGPSGKQGVLLTDVDPSFGFITRSVDDLAWICSKTIGKSVDTQVPYLYGGQWDSQRFQKAKSKKMRLGYIIQDGQMATAPAIKNCILEMIEKCRENGYEVVSFDFPELNKFHAIAARQQFNGQSCTSHNEHMISYMKQGSQKLIELANKCIDPYQKEMYLRYTGNRSLLHMFGLIRDKNLLKTQFLKKWRQMGLDGLISPVMPFTAPLQHSSHHLVHQLTFCSFQNIMELPCGCIPIRRVLPGETEGYPSTTFYENRYQRALQKSEGLPVAIQVTGAHLQDEQCVALMWNIQKLRKQAIETPFK